MLIRLSRICLLIFIQFSCSTETLEKARDSYLFEEVSPKTSGIDFVNQIEEDANHNIINYIYYYNGGGVAVGDIDNDGLTDIFFVSNQGKNKLYLNKGGLKFEDISDTAGTTGKSSWNTGVAMVDINGDGYLDIYVCAVSGLLDFKGHNELFINNGDGTFSEKSKKYGLDYKGFSTQSYFFDYDKDGDLDVYIVNHAVHTTLSHGPADVRNKRVPLVGDVLFKNEGGKFVDVSDVANIYGGVNGYGLSASVSDFNNDGWDDIYVCNDFHEDDYYYINNRDGSFTESLAESFSTISRFSMGSDAADVNNDGYFDLITLDMLPSDERIIKESEGDDAMINMQERLKNLGYKDQYSRNMLQMNNRGLYFSETAIMNGISSTDWSWAPLIADFDNDGHQDVFISNGILRRPNDLDFKQYVSAAFKNRGASRGVEWLYKSIDEMPSGKAPNQIFKGNSKKFSDKTGEWIHDTPSLSNGAAYADLDRDGDLDLILNNLNAVATIFENTMDNKKNHFSLEFLYKDKNLEGIGTKAFVYANSSVQAKQLFRSRGFLSSVDGRLNFGLDTIAKIDSVQIIWPDLTLQTLQNPVLNQDLVVEYVSSNRKYSFDKDEPREYFKETDEIEYHHREDSYYDNHNERLIPYRVSLQGPAYTVADFDNNGFEDIFLGNSSGKKPALFSNNGQSFSKVQIPAIEADSLSEDNDALFFDADNDNDLDLYVASGIDNSQLKYPQEDRLYVNTNGKFEKSENFIPVNSLNTSCVISNDYDSDGDLDLFVGNLSDPADFGTRVKSYLLKNDGRGKFSVDENFELLSKVTGATWKDINEDGTMDLLVATEWDTPKVFVNLKGRFSEIEIAKEMSGLWQSVTSFDVDEDGDLDILLGNWGLNTKFSLNNGPLEMYHNDFDRDGKKEVIVAYLIDGKYYPINSKDELGSQMKVISKRFPNYKGFAGKTVGEIVGEEVLEKSEIYRVQKLASGYLENVDGSFKKFIPFAPELQVAPINSFTEIELESGNYLLVSGNSLRVNTYHGGYTSLKGILLKNSDDFEPLTNWGVAPFNEQIKGTAIIQMENKNLLFVLPNNGEVRAYSYEKFK